MTNRSHPLTESFARILMAADQRAHDGGPFPDAIEAAFSATSHDGDCTKQCHTCLLCLANQYRAEAAIALPALLRHPAMRELQGSIMTSGPMPFRTAWTAGLDALAREVEESR